MLILSIFDTIITLFLREIDCVDRTEYPLTPALNIN